MSENRTVKSDRRGKYRASDLAIDCAVSIRHNGSRSRSRGSLSLPWEGKRRKEDA